MQEVLRSLTSSGNVSSGCMQQEFTDQCSPSWAGGDPPPLPELPSAKCWTKVLRKVKKYRNKFKKKLKKKVNSPPLPELPSVKCEIAICFLQTFKITSCQALTFDFSSCLFSVLVYKHNLCGVRIEIMYSA